MFVFYFWYIYVFILILFFDFLGYIRGKCDVGNVDGYSNSFSCVRLVWRRDNRYKSKREEEIWSKKFLSR